MLRPIHGLVVLGARNLSKSASPSQFADGVGVTGRYSNRQITQLAARLLDWALENGPIVT